MDEHRLRRLIDVGRGLVAQLDLEAVLREVVEAARELTGARYAALGILDEDREELERFIYVGSTRVMASVPFPAAAGSGLDEAAGERAAN